MRSWLSRPRRMNWPVTASSRHNSVAVMADCGGRVLGQADGQGERGRDRCGGAAAARRVAA